jgi:uncharacterized repeat protein (TIGR01451 family)
MRALIRSVSVMVLCLAVVPAAWAGGVTGDDIIRTFAGTGAPSMSGDGGPALAAALRPYGLAFDTTGNLYVTDADNHVVRMIDPSGIITRVAGTGAGGLAGDGGPAIQAQLNEPTDVAVDASGNVYIADAGNHRIRKIHAQTRTIRTIAGTTAGFGGDGGPAEQALLQSPRGVAVGLDGTVYIADTGNHRVRKIVGGTILPLAGGGTQPPDSEGPASQASLNRPEDVVVDASGNVYVADWGNRRVRWIDAAQNIHPYAGGGVQSPLTSGTPPLQTSMNPRFLARDGEGNLYIADRGSHLSALKVDPARTVLTLVVNQDFGAGFTVDGDRASLAKLGLPSGVAVDALGSLYIADTDQRKIFIVTAPSQQPNLEVTKSCEPNPASTGQEVRCTIRVKNLGPGGATNVRLTDMFGPASGGGTVTDVSATPSRGTCPTAASSGVTCDLGNFSVFEEATVTLSFKATQAGMVTDTAQAQSAQDDADSLNDATAWTTVITPGEADLEVTQQAASASVTVGREARFSIRVTNNGPNPVTGEVSLTDIPTLPPERVLAQQPPWNCSDPGVLPVSCTLPRLGPGRSAPRVEVTLVPTAPGPYCSSASVQADQTDPVATNNVTPQLCVTAVRAYALNEFVAFGGERLLIDLRSRVNSGAVGANTRGAGNAVEVTIRGPLAKTHPAFFVLGDTVQLIAAQVQDVRANDPVQLANGAAVGQQQPAGTLPALVLPALQPANPEPQPSGDIVVTANQSMHLAPGRYRNVTVNEGATLYLHGYRRPDAPPGTPRDYDFLGLELKAGANLLFNAPSIGLTRYSLGMLVRVQRRIRTGRDAVIGPASTQGRLNGSHIVFHVGGGDLLATQPQNFVGAVDIGRNSRLRANIFAPKGSVILNIGVRGTGAFIGRNFAGVGVDLTLESAF